MKITKEYLVFEEQGIGKYLEKVGILSLYLKVKNNFQSGRIQQINLKKEHQRVSGLFNFELTKNIVLLVISRAKILLSL